MNWPLFAAGLISLSGALIHGVVGDRIVRRLDTGTLPKNPFGDGSSTKFLIRVSWHFVTIAFVVLGSGLVLVSMRPESSASTGVAYVAGAAVTCWVVFALTAVFFRGGVIAWTRHPAPYLLSAASALIWWGAASLPS